MDTVGWLRCFEADSRIESAIDALASWPILVTLMHITSDVRDAHGAEQLVGWLWEVTSKVVEGGMSFLAAALTIAAPSLAKDVDASALSELIAPISRATSSDPVDLSDLSSSCEIIETLASRDNVDVTVFLDYWTVFTDFVHHAEIQDEEQTKVMSKCKESIIRGLVDLSACPTMLDHAVFWSCMREWLKQTERSDMTMCALLCFGNGSMSDLAAVELVPRIMDDLVPILKPSTPVNVQHALLGLLRNLSIPAANKELLGEDVLDGLVGMDPWNTDKDLVGSVQGGAVALVKNLCRDNGEGSLSCIADLSAANSRRFIKIQAGVDAVYGLMARTDDQAIRFEATRIFVNVIRSFAKDSVPLDALANERTVGYLCELVRLGGDKPILVNEGLIALNLLATFTRDGSVIVVEKLLAAEEGSQSALAALSSAWAAHRNESAYEGIWKNAATLTEKLQQRAEKSSRDRLEVFQRALQAL